MRKKDHIHIHALLAEVTRHLIENDTMPVERLSAYDSLETRPTSIHRPKQNHREAIMLLGSAIEPCLEETRTDSHEQPVNR
jgi:hypothetical protein